MARSWSSSSSGGSRRGIEFGRSSAPVPYRERPLEYEPAVFCKCKATAARWISWSDDNPGRRYLKCVRAREGGCNFYRWFDDETSEFLRQLLIDLRDTVRALKKEKIDLSCALEEQSSEIDAMRREMAAARRTASEKEAENGVFSARVHRLQKEKLVLMVVSVSCIVAVFVLMLSK